MDASPSERIRLLIIDDHAIMRQGLRMLVEDQKDMAVVGEADGGQAVPDLIARIACDVVLLDLALGDENGIDLLAPLAAADKPPRVLVLTGVRDPDVHRQALRRGAAGIVLKTLAPDLLIKAIRRVHDGEIWMDPSMASELFRELRPPAPRPRDPDLERIAYLTQREREIAKLVAQGIGTKKIASRLNITEKTVRNHLVSIYDKLQVSGRLELALYAARHDITGGVT